MRRPEARSEPPPPSAPPKRERSAAATQERILDAAEHEFAARGFAGARLRDVAVAAGIQPALIHHYFADKQGLYEAVIHRAVEQMSTATWGVLSKETNLEGLVRGFVDVMVDFSETHQKLLSIMRTEVLSGSGLLVEVIREKSRPILEAVVKIAAKLQEASELRADVDPTEMVEAGLSLILYPIVDAPVLRALLPEPSAPSSLERRKRVIADVLLRGIRAR
ncbi:MAG: TetR/AcrR family transcriptional regulator [Polyangiaceae bacterium]|nr:TetR/AcrR family transcriptional regulator [Polyangiaceae bacterium]